MTKQNDKAPRYSLMRTLLAGWVILAIITPLSQFLTIKAVNASVETDTPVAWALGLVISIVIAGLVIRVLAKRQVFNKANLALLYGMLALAVPLMNIGLVRQFFLSSHTVVREYMYEGTSTYRTAYNALNDRWFPVVPTREGLAWSRSERVLRLLDDAEVRRSQAIARRQFEEFTGLLQVEGVDRAKLVSMQPRLLDALPDLSLDDTTSFLFRTDPEILQQLELQERLKASVAKKTRQSEQAKDFLDSEIEARDEWALSLLERNLKSAGYSSRERLLAETETLPEEVHTSLEQRASTFAGIEDELRSAVMALGEADRRQLFQQLNKQELARVDGVSRLEFLTERNQYVFRLDRDERRTILQMDGSNGPNQNLFAFIAGLWNTPQEKAAMEAMGSGERVRIVFSSIPWSIYLWPLLSWGLLFSTIFGFLMCLAEWLRRKWVSRENLPFPLVEVADYVIRHDHSLETAGDLANPSRRPSTFSSLFLIGLCIGFLMLFAQGLGHYGFINSGAIIKFDFSKNIFEVAGGALKNLPTTVFVLSPIVLGIVFLLSLEIGFSIWISFIIYAVVTFLIKAGNPTLTDGNWTGWSDGKLYPFTMEQMLGAVLCFSVYHLWKVHRQTGSLKPIPAETYVSGKLTRWGLVLLPAIIYLMLWDLGLKNIPMLLIFSLAILAISVAVARVRAETGFPGGHAIFEFTKLPIIFGMTGAMGAKVYASFINIVFLPTTLLFRTLPQQLENMELARRYKVPFSAVAISGLSSVLVTIAFGFVGFLAFSYAIGDEFYGFSVLPPYQSGNSALAVATYPLWVSHFLGEPGLSRFTEVNWYRLIAIAGGFSAVGILLLIRKRFMRFPIHPIGYLVLLMTILYSFETPYQRVPEDKPLLTSTIWGSALLAWLIKRVVVKYGGMNVYKQAKPLFVGLIVGSVFAIFFWNMAGLGISLYAVRDIVPNDFIRRFVETAPFTPAFF
jgi:hypothetical protein